jgi:alpha-L-rhamnosidase
VRLPEYEKPELTLEAGSYDFQYKPGKNFRQPYSKDTTLSRLAQDEKAMAILGKYTPAVAGMAASGDPEMGAKSLEDLMGMMWLPFDPTELAKAVKEIKEIVVE